MPQTLGILCGFGLEKNDKIIARNPAREEKMDAKPKKLLDPMRGAIRAKHYSCRTEGTCLNGARRYISFHNPCTAPVEVTPVCQRAAVKVQSPSIQ
jgi:hypothetical protein